LVLLRCRKENRDFEKPQSSARNKNAGRTRTRNTNSKRKPKSSPLRSLVVSSGGDQGGTIWKPRDVTFVEKPVGFLKRMSHRFMAAKGCYQPFGVPYFDRWGRNTGERLYTIVATLPQMFTSLVATKISRVKRFLLKTSNFYGTRSQLLSLGSKVAILSFIIGNDYLLDRLYALRSKRGLYKIIHGMMRKCIAKLSDDKWFVYRHTSLQVKWLDLRGKRPRDKLKLISLSTNLACKHARLADTDHSRMYTGIHHIFSNSGLYRV
jgi:hypothetical protein